MGRPWEYPRWKRVLMQVTMWLIFGGTLGLAQFVSGGRRSSPQVDLGPPRSWGRLSIRVPQDWTITKGKSDRTFTLEGQDPDDPRRLMFIRQQLPAPGSEVAPDESDDENAAPSSEPIDFTGLGRRGMLFGVLRPIPTIRGGPHVIATFLRAAVRLPDGLVVTVDIGEVGTRIGSADLMLLKEIVQNIRPGPKDDDPTPGGLTSARPGRQRTVPANPAPAASVTEDSVSCWAAVSPGERAER